MDVQLGSTHRYSSVWTDASGNPTNVDVRSPAVMAADDPSRVSVVPEADGLSGTITFAVWHRPRAASSSRPMRIAAMACAR